MNIIYIHTHDTGKVISPYGYNVISPNIDKFFEDSIIFHNAFSAAPTCSPSRAALLTGSYPHQVGMLGLAQRGFEIDANKHLAGFLKNNGYHTILSGVQHEMGYYLDHDKVYKDLGYLEDITEDHRGYKEEDLIFWDEKNSYLLQEWIKNYKDDKPFFISYGLHGTHRKYPEKISENVSVDTSVPPPYINNNPESREDFAKYKTSLEMSDKNIGRILETLKEKGYYDNSIIFITTDHGLAYPFSKCTLKDRGIGILLSMRVPNGNKSIKSYDGLISQIDIFPTICDLIGVEKPDYLEGKSFAKLFKDESGKCFSIRDEVYAEINFHTSYEPVRSVRTKRYKYIRFFDEEYLKINCSNIDSSPVKEFMNEHGLKELDKPNESLYDLYYDPIEENNLASNPKYEGVLNELRRKMDEFMKNTKDPLLNGHIEIKDQWKVNKKECYYASSKNPQDYISMGRKDK